MAADKDTDRSVLGLLKATFRDFSEDECPTRAAALAYYTVFALPSLLILILLVAGLVWEPHQVQEHLQGQFGAMLGESGKAEAEQIFANAEKPDMRRGVAGIIGVAALIFGATGAFGQLQGALNRAWEVKPDPEQGGLKTFLFKRVLSFGMILGIAFLLLVSLALSAALSAFGDYLGRLMPGVGEAALHAVNFVISFGVVFILFSAILKILPDAEIGWRDVWVGAGVTTLLFVVGKYAIGFYLGRSNPGEAFGAAASLAILLVWVYYASMIMLFGAEFTQTWAERRGGGIRPEAGAVKVVEETREVRGTEAKREA